MKIRVTRAYMYSVVNLFIDCCIALYQLCIFRFTSIFDIVHKTESDTTGILIHMREEILKKPKMQMNLKIQLIKGNITSNK